MECPDEGRCVIKSQNDEMSFTDSYVSVMHEKFSSLIWFQVQTFQNHLRLVQVSVPDLPDSCQCCPGDTKANSSHCILVNFLGREQLTLTNGVGRLRGALQNFHGSFPFLYRLIPPVRLAPVRPSVRKVPI